ncbi:MAG TPA: CBS domain-containing protein [Nitrosospira sp.]|nr:CBS domain-containing protein [Nitrosospira sp.]
MSDFHVLSARRLAGTVRIVSSALPKPVTLLSPALEVMTDLRYTHAAVIDTATSMEAANAYMIKRGVRSLLVLDRDKNLCGFITASDILGEKPLRFIQERQVKHNEILVADIMTPLERLEAVTIEEVQRVRVGDVITSLQDSGRQHSLVIASDESGTPVVCGIFSLTQIEKQLGVTIPSLEVARTFTEIEAALIH